MGIFFGNRIMALNIPEREYGVLRKIAELDDSLFTELLSAIDGADTKTIQSNLSESLSKKLPGMPSSDLKVILRTISALSAAMQYRGKSIEDFVNDLKETIENEKPEGFPLEKAGLLKQRIQKVFNSGKLIGLTSKSVDLLTEQDRIFCGVRVMSDIRPVFQDSTDSISAAMVVHYLRVKYHQDGKHSEFTVALNKEDIRKMLSAMERAEKKNNTLRKFIQDSNIPYFEDLE